MKLLNIISLSIGLVLLSTSAINAKTSVWKVSKGNHHLYLGGTIHVLGEQDYPLPCEYQLAYDQSERLIFETDLAVINSPKFAQEAALAGLYPQGKSIEDRLSPRTLQSLKLYLESLGLPFQNMARFKPGMLMSIITLMELQRLGISAKGVDQYYSNLAGSEQKEVGHLETPQQQIELIVSLGENNEEKFVQYLLESMSDFEQKFSDIKAAWRDGDIAHMSSISETEIIRADFPRLFNALFTQRNNAWMPQIESMLETQEVEYILVGALHLADDVGLIAQLKGKGFALKQLSGCKIASLK